MNFGREILLRLGTIPALGLSLLCFGGSAVAAEREPAPISIATDFDAAIKGLKFDPATVDGNRDATGAANGILDADEMALLAAILQDSKLDLSATGGVDHASVTQAFRQAQASAAADVRRLAGSFPTAATVTAGYAMLGEGSFRAFNAMTTGFGAPLRGDYALALKVGQRLSPEGDADGDGVSNRAEYAAAGNRAAYIRAALNPTVKVAGTPPALPAGTGRKVIGVVLYPGFEVLDVFGPVEMWANVPDFQVVMIAEKGGLVRSAQGAQVMADYDFDGAPKLDVMMVPGGVGTRAELENPVFLNFLRRQDKTTEFTTSVCSGSALLAKAGLLKGRKATSNKAFFSLATSQDASVDWRKEARWVEDGKFFTSSGVSAGTDMALGLVARIYGKDQARRLARSLEYQWSEDADNDPFAIP
jgi:putative intracellular protease/amidase